MRPQAKEVKEAHANSMARCWRSTEAKRGGDQNLVVDDKWLASISRAVEGEVQRLTQHSPPALRNWKNATLVRFPNWSVRSCTQLESRNTLEEDGVLWDKRRGSCNSRPV